MRPQFLTQDSINSINVSFDEAKLHYMRNDKDWFIQRFEQEHGLRNSRFDFPDFELAMSETATAEEFAVTDGENVRKLYSVMKSLPVSAAADQRFWSGLAHTYCWDYMQYRRQKELASGDDKAIKTSFFYTYDEKRSSHVNCLSRLWWAGRITYDEDNAADPFALTDLLTSNAFASRILLVSSNNFAANKDIALGMLDAIKTQRDAGVKLRREHFVGASKYLNRMGAITILDCLGRRRVKELVDEFFGTEEFAKLKV